MKYFFVLVLIYLLPIYTYSKERTYPANELNKKGDLVYKKKKRFSGIAYILNSSDTLVNSIVKYRYDSIYYTFEKGFCTQAGFVKKQKVQKSLSRQIKNKQLHTSLFIYDYRREIIDEEHQLIDGKLHTIRNWSFGYSGWGKDRKHWRYINSVYRYENDKLNGICMTYHSDSTKASERIYLNNQLNGKSTFFDKKGLVTYERFYDKGRKTKEIIYHYNSTQVKSISIYEGYRRTEMRVWSYNGKPIFQNINNKKDSLITSGKYVLVIRNGYESVHYKNGVKDGLWRKYYNYNTKHLWEEKTYKNGKLEGKRQKWYKNDTLAFSVNYINGKKEGIQKQWYANGKKWTLYNFVNGKEDGVYKRWYKNGTLSKTGKYIAGKPTGIHNYYYDDGKKWRIYTYKDTTDGLYCLYESWWGTGKKYEEYETLNGKKHGYYKKWWNTNGNIRLYVDYTNGRKNGKYKNWLENGTIYRDWNYEWNARVLTKEEKEQQRQEYYKRERERRLKYYEKYKKKNR